MVLVVLSERHRRLQTIVHAHAEGEPTNEQNHSQPLTATQTAKKKTTSSNITFHENVYSEQVIDVPDYQNIKVEQDNLVEFGLLPRSEFVEDSPETLLTATQSRTVNLHIMHFPELP